MEPNASRSCAAETSSTIVKQEPSSNVQVPSLLSLPSFISPPSHELVFKSDSRSRLPVVGDDFVSIHGHAVSHSVPSSVFPATLGTAHMTGSDVFTSLQASAATPFPILLDGQPRQRLAQLPSWTTVGMGRFSGFGSQAAMLEQITAWPRSKMPFFSPTACSGLPLCSNGDNCVKFTQPSSKYKLPPLLPSLRAPSKDEASMHKMLGAMGGTMPCHYHYGGSSMAVGSSIASMPNLPTATIKMKEPMLPLTRPSSQGACASSNFIGFTQPSSNSNLMAFQSSLQEVPLPVKQEPIDAAATHRDLEFKSVLSNKQDKANYDVIPHRMPDNSIVSGQNWSWEAALKHSKRSRNNVSSTRIAGSTHCHDQSSSMVINNSSSTPKLSQRLPPSSLWAGASSSRRHVTGVTFTNAEKEKIRKDKNLQDLLKTDPKKVKRLVSNRICAAKRKAIKDMHTLELEHQVVTLQRKCNTKSAELQLYKEQCAELKTEYNEMSVRMQELERQLKLKEGM